MAALKANQRRGKNSVVAIEDKLSLQLKYVPKIIKCTTIKHKVRRRGYLKIRVDLAVFGAEVKWVSS